MGQVLGNRHRPPVLVGSARVRFLQPVSNEDASDKFHAHAAGDVLASLTSNGTIDERQGNVEDLATVSIREGGWDG